MSARRWYHCDTCELVWSARCMCSATGACTCVHLDICLCCSHAHEAWITLCCSKAPTLCCSAVLRRRGVTGDRRVCQQAWAGAKPAWTKLPRLTPLALPSNGRFLAAVWAALVAYTLKHPDSPIWVYAGPVLQYVPAHCTPWLPLSPHTCLAPLAPCCRSPSGAHSTPVCTAHQAARRQVCDQIYAWLRLCLQFN